MRALASGPFGILVMVAPLVAIPILSTFGIPQFAPLVAAPSENEDGVDIVPARPEDEGFADLQPSPPPSTPATTASRTADDLFAPLDAPRREPRPRSQPGRLTHDSTEPETSSGLVPLISPSQSKRIAQGPRSRASDSADDPAMSGWDAIPEGAPSETESEFDDAGPLVESLNAAQRAAEAEPKTEPKGLRLPRELESQIPVEQPFEGELTWKEATKQLNEFGIHKYILESQPDGGFQFRCAVTDPDNPQVDRQFRTHAEEPLVAVERALKQIEAFRTSR